MAHSTEQLAKRRRIDGSFTDPPVKLAINCNIEPRPIVLGPVSSVDGDISTGGDSGFQDLDDESRAAPSTIGLLTPSSIDDEPHSSSGGTNGHPGSSPLTMDEDDQVNVNIMASEKLDVENCSGRVEKSSACNNSSEDQVKQQVAHEKLDQDVRVDMENDGNDDDDDDDEDAASDISSFSCLSGMSGEDWKPVPSGPIEWVQEQIQKNNCTPRELLQHILPAGYNAEALVPPSCNAIDILRIIFEVLNQPPKRTKLPSVNLLEDVVELIRRSSRILVLTGAGVSVSCGIPDFRSKDGVYARLNKEFPTLPDPQAMFDIHYFRRDPRPFFKFAKEIYPGQFEPSPSHKFIQQLESHGKLLRNYTQNIDTLEHSAGIKRVINCHGSFATASCTRCKYQVDASFIKEDIFQQRIPLCPKCPPDSPEFAVMKPDIVFFGESLPSEFHKSMTADKDKVDLLIVMGSSLKVRPVSLIPSSLDASVPQILINREPLGHMNFDVELLGNCDVIVQEITNRLGGSWVGTSGQTPLTQLTLDDMNNFSNCSTFADSQMKKSISSTVSDVSTTNSTTTCTPLSPSTTTTNTITMNSNSTSNVSQNCRGQNLVQCIPETSYLFIPPSRYIFKGAELNDSDSDDDSGSDSDSSSDSPSDDEDEDTSDISKNVQAESNTATNTTTTTTNYPSLSLEH